MPFFLASKAPPILGTSTRINDNSDKEAELIQSGLPTGVGALPIEDPEPQTTSEQTFLARYQPVTYRDIYVSNPAVICLDHAREVLKNLLMLEMYMLRYHGLPVDANTATDLARGKTQKTTCIAGMIRHALLAEGFAEAALLICGNDNGSIHQMMVFTTQCCKTITSQFPKWKSMGNNSYLAPMNNGNWPHKEVRFICDFLENALGYQVVG